MTRKPTKRPVLTVNKLPRVKKIVEADPPKPAPDWCDRLRWLVLQVESSDVRYRRAMLSALVESFGMRLQ